MPSRFVDALLASPLPVIMEVKRADGEGRPLLGERTIPEIVAEYTAAGAPCISVVTGRWFGGDNQMLVDVAELTDLPLLQKDFITRESQIAKAVEMGASAVLLTVKILPKVALPKLIDSTLDHGLTPFVEVVDEAELARVTHPESCVVAVNNKDINTRERGEGDIDVSRAMLEAVLATGTTCPVSASAITDPTVGAELVEAGFKGLLIGTRLLRSGSVQGWVDEFDRERDPTGIRVAHRTSFPMTMSLFDHFAAQARTQPDAPALIWEGETISYAELAEMAAAAHAEIEAADIPADRPVGLRARKSPEAVALILGCLASELPFLLPSVELAPETLAKLFAQGGASRVLEPHGPRSESASLRAIQRTPEAEVEDVPVHWPPADGADEVTFMLTTSGSTGLPKVVPLPGRAVDAFTDWAAEAFDIGPGTVVANYAPLNFDLCLLDIWTTLKHGGCVALVDQDRATQGAYLADLITENDVNVVQAVPMLYRLLIDATRDDGRTFPGVRHAITTGDKIPATSLQELPRLFPNARFYNIYGCTETNDSLMHEFLGLADGNVPTSVPLGKPLPGVVALIKAEDGSFLDGEGKGEFLVRTPFQTRGYLNAALNEEKFGLYGDDDAVFYRSGDIVRRHDDGTISLEGRADFYVKVRGVRVSTQVVEQAVQEHPDVVEVAVVALTDELAGARLHAVVYREPDSTLNSLGLRKHCATRLARTEMPSIIEFRTEPLPHTSTGKVDRKRVLAQLEEKAHANG